MSRRSMKRAHDSDDEPYVTHIHVHTTNAHFYHGKYMQKKDLCSELTVRRPCVEKNAHFCRLFIVSCSLQ